MASMLVCLISGVFLAIPFDVSNPYDSISYFLLTSPAAVLFRNLHYWSAQVFLIFTILHFWDHLYRSTESQVKKGVWLRLVIAIFFIFYVMLSGFILKGDADSMQARRIFDSLLSQIPLIGELLAFSLLGKSDSFQLIYVHHIATASIFLVIIIVEHAKSIWARVSTLIFTSLIILVFSYFFQAPLHDNLQNLVKGPWYFLGLQEILHWTSRPVLLLIALLILFFVLYWVKGMKPRKEKVSKSVMLGFFILYLGLTLTGYFFRGENWTWTWNVREAYFPFRPDPIKPGQYFDLADTVQVLQVLGRREGCVSCHGNVAGLSASHDPMAIGCSSCHLGNPFTPDKDQAHHAMILIPGNLDQAGRTCGSIDCHPEISTRIQSSMMSTLSGIVSVDRFVFGESDQLSVLSDIREIGHSPADEHLRNLCARCHLGKEKPEPGAIDQLSRGGGCNACHLSYSEEALKALQAYSGSLAKDTFLIRTHPSMDIKVSNDHCFGCHSRSGRISTSYEGWHETLLEEENVNNQPGYRVLQDKRVFEFIQADVHHKAGMECIDCHNSYELMGDGNLYLHKEEAVSIQCEDCHFQDIPEIITYSELDPESQKIVRLRSFDTIIQGFHTTKKHQYPLLNTYISASGNASLVLKNSGRILALNPPKTVCTSTLAHADLTCESCHTAWTPQCIGCHNEFDQQQQGYDLLADRERKGAWVEYAGRFLAEKPTLGVRYFPDDTNEQSKSIITVTPGMIMSIDIGSFYQKNKVLLFHRLFAPVSAHTTSIQGRNCKSCHNDPLAIGYGRGELVYIIEGSTGKWEFTPQYAANEHDGLPEDAWIAFLSESNSPGSTRDDIRPFSIE
ncbi:MAG: hypothetical protein U9R60_10670, partial [Bacteroidota bacterium]|nr:hypothetical protein [Bacteroidota bacterium]